MAKRPVITGKGSVAAPSAIPNAGRPGGGISYPVRHPNQPPDPGARRRIGLPAKNPMQGYGGEQQQGRR